MNYRTRQQAEAAMAAWAEVSSAPALALVRDPAENRYLVVETCTDGIIVVRRGHTVLDTVWTAHSVGVTALVIKNAYTVSCCYPRWYARDEIVLTEHGETDLTEALNAALEAADSSECWRSCDGDGDSYIEAIAEGGNVDPWTRDVPVPEAFSGEGPCPIILIRMAGGRIDDVRLVRGEAHVVAVNRDGEALDRGPHITVRDELGDLSLTHWTGPADPASLPRALLDQLGLVAPTG